MDIEDSKYIVKQLGLQPLPGLQSVNKVNTFNNYVYKKKVKDINLTEVRPQRAGVILYTKLNNVIYFGMGIDYQSGEYTDFGGGISYKEGADENVIVGALREFAEETLGIFGYVNPKDVEDCLTLYSNNNLIIFKQLPTTTVEDMRTIVSLFEKEYQKVSQFTTPEVANIVWLSQNDFKTLITQRGNLFYRIQNFLQKAGNFYWLL
jgi:hypothetical protein